MRTMTSNRKYTAVDQLLSRVDNALRTLTPGVTRTQRPLRESRDDNGMPAGHRRHTAGLMRINHTGEVCAQALYQGQATTARLPHVRHAMEQAAQEEEDHLAWCETRLRDLDAIPSRLNPIFYALSFSIGAVAGVAGDRWSLGFVSETERQVVRHLESHLAQIPSADEQTRRILEQMRDDELKHATTAEQAGGAELPPPVKGLMRVMSKVMTFTTYRL